jgi:hypothetical protein
MYGEETEESRRVLDQGRRQAVEDPRASEHAYPAHCLEVGAYRGSGLPARELDRRKPKADEPAPDHP